MVAVSTKLIEILQRHINISFMNELSIIFSKIEIPTKAVLRKDATKK